MSNCTSCNGVIGDLTELENNTISANVAERKILSNEEILKFFYLHVCPVREDYIKRLIIFVIFIIFGVLGNVTIKHRNPRNAPNILISNLARLTFSSYL